MRRVVVAGNGIAGVTAAESLRMGGFDGQMTIVGAESGGAYSRPALSKEALREADIMTAHLLPEMDLQAQTVLGTRVTSLDAERRRVTLSNGESLDYDGLVIATGSHANRLTPPSLPDRAGPEITLRTVADAEVLRERIASRPDVVIIGSGPLAMEVASECRRVGCPVILVTQHDPMSRHLGRYLGGVLTEAAQVAGVRLLPAAAVAVRADQGRVHVRLADGTEVSGAVLISAIGDTPNTDWLAGSGLLVDGELRTDAEGRVREDIVAAGDVAAFPTVRGVMRMPLWFSAIERAKIAAQALLDADYTVTAPKPPYFWTEQFGYAIRSCGDLPLEGNPEVVDGDVTVPRALLRWASGPVRATAVAVNYPISVPKLRRMAVGQDAPVAAGTER